MNWFTWWLHVQLDRHADRNLEALGNSAADVRVVCRVCGAKVIKDSKGKWFAIERPPMVK